MEYFGHIISKERVVTDPKKLQAVADWLIPSNLKQLWGFLGLDGYYRRFVQGFGKISQPLIDLIKKNSFN